MICPRCGADSSQNKVFFKKNSFGIFDVRIHTCLNCDKKENTFNTIELPQATGVLPANIVIKDTFGDTTDFYEIYNPYRIAEKVIQITGLNKDEALKFVDKLNKILRRIPKENKVMNKTQLVIIATQALYRLPYEGLEYRKEARHLRSMYLKTYTFVYNNTEINPAFLYFKYFHSKFSPLIFKNNPINVCRLANMSAYEAFVEIVSHEVSYFIKEQNK